MSETPAEITFSINIDSFLRIVVEQQGIIAEFLMPDGSLDYSEGVLLSDEDKAEICRVLAGE